MSADEEATTQTRIPYKRNQRISTSQHRTEEQIKITKKHTWQFGIAGHVFMYNTMTCYIGKHYH